MECFRVLFGLGRVLHLHFYRLRATVRTVATVVDTVFFKYIRRFVFVGDNLADSLGFVGFHIPIYFYFPEIPGIVNTIYRRKSFEVYGYLFYTFGYKKRDYPNEWDNLFSIW